MMIDLEKLCSAFRSALGWPYVSPGGTGVDCSQTGIDCSGMFVRAYKLQGASIYHGSNHIWRDGSLTDKGKLTNAAQLVKGAAVFKWSSTGEPSQYEKDGLGNFHHIGLVVSTQPLEIIHASSAKGFVTTDSTIKGWTHWGKLKAVDYSGEEHGGTETMTTYKVIAASGSTVNLRKSASTTATILAKVPIGDTVTGDAISEGWAKVAYNGVEGYMMDKFLEEVSGDDDLASRVAALEEEVAALKAAVEELKGVG